MRSTHAWPRAGAETSVDGGRAGVLVAALLVADVETSGLAVRVYTHTAGTPWPTLAPMLDAGTRLPVTAENGAPPPAWFHHVRDLTWTRLYLPQHRRVQR